MNKFSTKLFKYTSILFVLGFFFFGNINSAFAATRTWTGTTSGSWSVAGNWGGTAPVTGDDLVFPGGASNLSNTNDFTENTIFNSITLSGSGYTLSGNPIIIGAGLAGITDSASSGGNTIALDVRLDVTRDIIVTNIAETLTISGRIAGAGGIKKEGSGKLILSGANTYGGITKINVGIINAQNSTSLGTIATGTEIVGNAALELQGNINISYEALALRGYGVNSAGALRNISGDNTYGGLISLSSLGGTEIASDAGTLTLTGGVTGAFGLTIDGSSNVTFSKTPIATGAGSVTKNGSGTLTYNFPNTYTGTTFINAGTLLYGTDNAILSGAITVTGGTLDIATYSDMVGTVTLGTLDLASGTITGSTGMLSSATWTVYSGTISAIIAGDAGALTKTTPGTVTLTRPNQYTGATTVSAGILKIQDSLSLGAIDGITTVSAGATLEIDGSGLSIPEYITFSGTGHLYTGSIRNKTGDNTITGLLTMGADAMIKSDASTTLTIDTKGISATNRALTIGGEGNTTTTSTAPVYGTTATLTKNDTGTLTIQSFSNLTGATIINKGTLVLSESGAMPLSTTMTINAGATLTLDNTDSDNVVDRIADSLALTMNGGNFNFIGSSSANMDETAGVLTSGFATQSGNNTITITPGSGGSTTMQFASLSRTAGSSLLFRGTSFGSTPGAGVSTLLFTSSPTLIGGAGLENTTTISIIAGAIGDDSLSGTGTDMVTYGRGNSNGLRLLNGAGFSGEYASNFATANANVKLTASTVAATSSINSLILSGSGAITDAGTSQTITLASASLSGNILNLVNSATIAGANTTIAGGTVELKVFTPSDTTISSLITTSGGVTKSGAGTLAFSTAKNYTGLTSVNGGTLLAGVNDFISSGNITVNGGTLDIATYSDTVGAVIMQNGTITGSTGVLTGTSYSFREGTVSAIIAGAVAVTRRATNTSADSVVSITRENTYTGATTITSGILKIEAAGNGANTPLGTSAGGVTIASGGALDLNGYTLSTSEAITSFAGTGFGSSGSSKMGAIMNSSGTPVSYSGDITLTAAARINADAGALTISSNISGNFALTFAGFSNINFSGIRSGTSTIVKEGIGVLTLSNGNSSYSGATTISAGTVKLGAASVGGTNSPLGTTAGITTIATGSRLDLNGFTLGIAEPTTINGVGYGLGDFASGSLMNSSASNVTYSGLITLGSASFIKADYGDINLTAAGTITGNGLGLTMGGAGNGTLDSIIGNTNGGVNKTGNGTWTVSGQSTHTGTTIVYHGTLKLGANGGATNTPLGTTALGVTVATGAVLDFNGYTIPTAEALTINGRGINNSGVIIGSNGTFGGTISQGTDSFITNASGTMTITGVVNGAFTLLVGGAGNITTSTVFPAVALAITKQGAGILTVTGSNLYTGETRIEAGTFAYAAATTLAGTNLVVKGGTFDNGANTDTIGAITLIGGTITNSAALTGTSYTLENGTVSGILAGAVAVTKNTNNTVTLTGVNTISSTTTINAGNLVISDSGSATSTTVTVNLGGALTLDNSSTAVIDRLGDALILTMNGGNFNFIGNSSGASSETTGLLSSLTGHNTVTVTPGAGGSTTMTFASFAAGATGSTILFRGTDLGAIPAANVSTLVFTTPPTLRGGGGASNSTTVSTVYSAFGDSSLSGTGSDMVTYQGGTGLRLLNGAGFSGEYSGDLSVNNSNVKLTADSAPAGGSINSIILNGYSIIDPGSPTTINMTGGGTLSGNILINSTTNIAGTNTTLGIGAVSLYVLATADSTISATIGSAVAGSLIVSGSGNVTITQPSLHTGTTYINNATLTYGTNNVVSSGGLTVVGGTVNLNGNSDTVGAISINAGIITTGAGTLTGNGTFTTVANDNVASFITGNLGLGSNATFTINNGLMDNDAVISAVISGAFTFSKAGTGTLELAGNNTYSGLTTISAGMIRLGASGDSTNTPLGTTAAGTTMGNGLTLDLNGFTLGTAEALTLNGNGLGNIGALINTSSTAVTYSGLITLAGPSYITANYGDINISNTGSMTGTGFALTLRGVGNGTLATQINTGTGGSLIKNDLGTWTVSGDSNYTGVTTVTSGILKLGAAGGATNTIFGTTAGATTVASGAMLDLNGFTLGTNESITISGTGIANTGAFINSSNNSISYNGAITLGAASRMVNHGTGVMTYNGLISGNFALTVVTVGDVIFSTASTWTGSGTLVKEGSGTLTLAGQYAMNGSMTISTGVLKLGADGGATNTPLGVAASTTETIAAGAVLDLSTFSVNGASTYERLNLSGTGIKNGGALISNAAGNNNFGAVTVAANAKIVNSGSGLITFEGTITAANAINLSIGGTGPTTITGVYGATATTATLTKWDSGTLTIGAASITTGLVRINGGTVKYGVNDTFATGALTIAGGTLDLNGFNETNIGAVTLIDGSIVNTGGAATLTSTATYVTENGTISAVLAGPAIAFTKNTGGTVTLSAANTFAGTTNINAGVLSWGIDDALSSGALTVTGGFADLTTHTDTVGVVTLTSGGITSSTGVLTGTSYPFTSGTVSAILGGAIGLTKTTVGTVTLSGLNTYTGSTTITAGVLRATSSRALGDESGTNTLIFNGGTLRAGGDITSPSGRAVTLTQSFMVDTNGYTVEIAGTVGSGSGIFKTGVGTLTTSGAVTLAATAAISNGTYNQAGSLSMTAGIMQVHASGVWSNTGTGAITLAGNLTNSGTITLNSNNGALCVDGADSIVIRSSVNNTLRSWSNGTQGAGTFNIYNVDVDDMTGAIVTAYKSTLSGDTTWTVGSCILSISGTANANDAATVKCAVNGSVQVPTTTISGSAWTITGIDMPLVNDIITVWVDNVDDNLESTAVTKWTAGNITGMVLDTNVLTIGSNQNSSISVTSLGLCDFDTGCADEDIMHTSDSGALSVQGSTNSYTDETLSVLASNTLTIASGSTESITTEKLNNAGTITATGTPDITLAGTSGTLFTNSGTFNPSTSTVNLTGNGDATVNSGSPTLYNLTSSGTGVKTLGAGLTINTSGTLSVTAGIFDPSTYLVTGSGTNTLSVGASGTIRVKAPTFAENYSAGFTTKTLATGSTVDYALAGTQTIDETLSYSNLNISGPGTKTLAGNTVVTDGLTITNGTLDTDINYGRSLSASYINIANNVDAAFIARTSAVTLTGTSGTLFTKGASGTFTAGTSTITLNGNGNATINSGSPAFYNLASTGTGTKTFGGDLTVSRVFTIGSSSTVNAGNYNLTLPGTTGAPFALSGTFVPSTGTVSYTGDYAIGDTSLAGVDYYGLTLNNPTEVYVLGSSPTIGGVLTITDATLDTSTYDITLSGTNGTPFVNNGIFHGNSGTVTYNGNNSGGNTTVAGLIYYNLVIDNSSETYVLGNDITGNVAGTLNINNGTLDTTGSDYGITFGKIDIANSATAELKANSSTILLTGTSGTLFTKGASGTFTPGTSNVYVTNSGNDWIEQTNPGARAWHGVASSDDGTKLAAVVYNGYIYTSTDSGATWSTNSNSSGSRDWTSIASSSDGVNLAATVSNGYIYTSTDSGATWSTNSNSSGSRDWTSIASSSDGVNLAATVNGGNIYTSTDSGANWINQTNSGSRAWTSIASSSNGTKLAAVGTGINVYTSTDSGATWTPQTNSGSRSWVGVASSADGTKIAAIPNNDYIYTSTDSGATWTQQTDSGSRPWGNISSSASGIKLVAGSVGGYVYTSSDYGVTWTEETSSGTRNWINSALSTDGVKLVIASYTGYIYTSVPSATPQNVTVATGGPTFSNLIIYSAGTKSLGENLTVTNGLTMTAGTLDTISGQNYTINAGSITINGGVFTPQESNVNINGTGLVFNYTSGSVSSSNYTIKLTDSSSTGKTFGGGGGSFNNVWFAPGSGTGTYTITGSSTFNDIKDDGSSAHSILFTSGTTQTIGSFTISGSVGNLITLKSTVDGAPWTVSDSSGTNTLNYISLADSIATGGAIFSALTSTDLGRNKGWILDIIYTISRGSGGGGVESDSNVGTCVDGIQNGDETGVDSGGRCVGGGGQDGGEVVEGSGNVGTCVDGIQNGDETGVDSGGRCVGGGGQGGGGGGDLGFGYKRSMLAQAGSSYLKFSFGSFFRNLFF
jgi:fibronectin-binding autotransporter adhesin